MNYLILFGAIMLASYLVSANLKSKFKKYAKIPLNYGLNGKEVAEKMLRDSGIHDVQVIQVEGQLTDHYNPTNKTVNLSRDVYYGNNVSAGAVAAHECGHAVQHARSYTWLTLRSKMVPGVSFASKYMQWVLLAGIFTVQMFPGLLLAGITLFAITTLFSFVTLPVEIDASQRALAWLRNSGITSYESQSKAEGALRAAAYTYVVAALGSLATLLYYIMIFVGGRD